MKDRHNHQPAFSVVNHREHHSRPRILFLDAYDSFTNNIVSLLTTLLDAEVRILEIDDEVGDELEWSKELARYDAVVCGPGPGNPEMDGDVGLMRRVWRQARGKGELSVEDKKDNMIPFVPTMGICLGFQSLVAEFGGKVRRLGQGLHGRVWRVDCPAAFVAADGGAKTNGKGEDIFDGLDGGFNATLYHSLGVVETEGNGHGSGGDGNVTGSQDLQPLAWARGEMGEHILMAVRHMAKPFWGLQYHPESVCTEETAHQVLVRWFEEAKRWNANTGRIINRDEKTKAREATRKSLLGEVERLVRDPVKCMWYGMFGRVKSESWGGNWMGTDGWAMDMKYRSKTIPLPAGATVPDIFELLRGNNQDAMLLESSNAGGTKAQTSTADVRGRYSILALNLDEALRIKYQAGSEEVSTQCPACSQNTPLDAYQGNVWRYLADFQHARRVPLDQVAHVPFAGGFMGYMTYEMGLHDIGVEIPKMADGSRGHCRPDVCLAWVTKSLVVDHAEGKVTVQCLDRDDPEWKADEDWLDDMNVDGLSRLDGVEWVDAVTETLEAKAWGGSDEQGKEEDDGDKDDDSSGDGNNRILTPTTSEGSSKSDGNDGDGTPDRTVSDEDDGNDEGDNYEARIIPIHAVKPNKYSILSIKTPDAVEYEAKVRACQEYIAAGDSYELCLTDQTTILRPRPRSTDPRDGDTFSWDLYKELRKKQPAPFASFVSLGQVVLVSASPERFLEYKPRPKARTKGTEDESHHDDRGDGDVEWVCTMRPMKGTVRKTPPRSFPPSYTTQNSNNQDGGEEGSSTEGVSTIEEARAILHTEKEMAENLMIVDLVRHDLHGVCGAGRVSVPTLLGVEEYESVWQMVSVVEGVLPEPPPSPPTLVPEGEGEGKIGGDHAAANSRGDGKEETGADKDDILDIYTGLDVLAASLPPGSMTGAPKKRSCEILQQLEGGKERGIYSGVVGYMDIAGRGDWSVTIRSLFRYGPYSEDDSDEKSGGETWRIGAGGAVTGLSRDDEERREMFTKLNGPLGVVRGMCGEAGSK